MPGFEATQEQWDNLDLLNRWFHLPKPATAQQILDAKARADREDQQRDEMWTTLRQAIKSTG